MTALVARRSPGRIPRWIAAPCPRCGSAKTMNGAYYRALRIRAGITLERMAGIISLDNPVSTSVLSRMERGILPFLSEVRRDLRARLRPPAPRGGAIVIRCAGCDRGTSGMTYACCGRGWCYDCYRPHFAHILHGPVASVRSGRDLSEPSLVARVAGAGHHQCRRRPVPRAGGSHARQRGSAARPVDPDRQARRAVRSHARRPASRWAGKAGTRSPASCTPPMPPAAPSRTSSSRRCARIRAFACSRTTPPSTC